MLFNSLQFLIFFPIVTFLYFLLPHRMRWFMLLVASCIFYMAFIPAYIFVLFTLILIDYFAAIWMERLEERKRKICLIISIVSTCLTLFIFKYFNFFNTNLAEVARFLHLNYPIGAMRIILPIGLSFHTFQSLSYVIEVYRKRQKPQHHFGIYALYVMFYPQLVAGPIERPYNLLHQFYEKHYFDYKRVTDGLKLMAWGMFKKVVIADKLAGFVDIVYNNPHGHQGVSLIMTTVFFAFQIYCDFSGYSDIAIGAAEVMGFRLMDNFNRPYFSKSTAEFWKRWHISLSSWFRDYLYIPLGGKRVSKARHYYNLLLTFLISGLWHGASWTYVFWGALNGLYVISGIMFSRTRAGVLNFTGAIQAKRVLKFIRVFITFSLICFAWIFFRANNINDAFYIATHLFSGVAGFSSKLFSSIVHMEKGTGIMEPILLGQGYAKFFIVIFSLVFLLFIHLIQRHVSIRYMLSTKPIWLRWGCYVIMVVAILIFGYSDTPKQFIYFQF